MESCRQYGGISRAELERLRLDAAKEGVVFPQGDSGTVSLLGVTATVAYTESTLTLKICIVKRPLLISEQLIWQSVESMVGPYVG
jgi:hypothetical protein